MVKKKKVRKVKLRKKEKKVKREPFIKGIRVSEKEIRKKLELTKMRTAKRILESPFSSSIEKTRARRLLSK